MVASKEDKLSRSIPGRAIISTLNNFEYLTAELWNVDNFIVENIGSNSNKRNIDRA
jgi:hypothetical protein